MISSSAIGLLKQTNVQKTITIDNFTDKLWYCKISSDTCATKKLNCHYNKAFGQSIFRQLELFIEARNIQYTPYKNLIRIKLYVVIILVFVCG